MKNFRRGQLVAIYEDPYSEEILEGYALLKYFKGEYGIFEHWTVQFLGEGLDEFAVERKILIKGKNKEKSI